MLAFEMAQVSTKHAKLLMFLQCMNLIHQKKKFSMILQKILAFPSISLEIRFGIELTFLNKNLK